MTPTNMEETNSKPCFRTISLTIKILTRFCPPFDPCMLTINPQCSGIKIKLLLETCLSILWPR